MLLESLHEFTMESVTASRYLDIFVLLSLLTLVYANRIITDTPGLHSMNTGKVVHESGVHEGQTRRDLVVHDVRLLIEHIAFNFS